MQKLYNYQKTGITFLKSKSHALLADEQGTGKTAQAVVAAKDLGLSKVLVICPASVKYNWKKEIDKWAPGQYISIIDSGKHTIPDFNYTIINYDLIHRKKIFLQLISRHYDLIICDECFHQDTLIKTLRGVKKIKYVRPGDYVWNCTGWDKVTGYYLKKLDYYIKIRYNGRDIKVSENHPFFTLKGWVKAKDLKKGDCLVETEQSQEILSGMQERATRRDTPEEKILQYLLLREMADGPAGNNQKDEESGTAAEDFRGVEARPRGKDPRREEKMSGMALRQLDRSAGSCTTPENKFHFETYKVVPRRSGGKWKTTSDTPEQTFKIARQVVASRVLCKCKAEARRLSVPLQDRYSVSPFEISNRSRRVLASGHRAEKTRHKEDKIFRTFRVESAEIYEFRSDGESGEGLADNIFFDLSVENHPSFTVNGALVHNSHYLKNNSAKRTKCVYYPRGLKDRSDRVWLLTGTPVLNRPAELFSHLKALAPERLGKYTSFKAYGERYCAAYEGKWGWDCSGASNLDELSGALNGFMLRRLKKDVLKELPDKTYQTITFPPSGALKGLAEKERKEYAKEKEGILGELATLRKQSGLAKLPQVTQHLRDLLETEEKIVVFGYHRDVISGLQKALSEFSPVSLTGSSSSRQRQEAVDRFRQEKTCRVFIGQIEAAGTGIDGLQDVCNTVIFAEITWVPGQIHQAIDRCHRIGQKNPVLVQFLIVAGSIDEDIAETVARKQKVIERVLTQPKEEPEMAEGKRVQVAITVELDAVTVHGAVQIVGETLEKKGVELIKVHGANVLVGVATSGPLLEQSPGPAPAPAPKKKAKAAPKAKVEEEVVADADGVASGPDLMKYCNKVFVGIKDAAERTAKIKEVAAMFRGEFGIAAIKELPAEQVADAKAKFDEIMA